MRKIKLFMLAVLAWFQVGGVVYAQTELQFTNGVATIEAESYTNTPVIGSQTEVRGGATCINFYGDDCRYNCELEYSFTVDGTDAGYYDLTVTYYDGDYGVRGFNIQVNDELNHSVRIDVHGGWTTPSTTTAIPVYLQNGTNIIRLSTAFNKSGQYTGAADDPQTSKAYPSNIDKLTLTKRNDTPTVAEGYRFQKNIREYEAGSTCNNDNRGGVDEWINFGDNQDKYAIYKVNIPQGKGGLYMISISGLGNGRQFTVKVNGFNTLTTQFNSDGGWSRNESITRLFFNLEEGENTIRLQGVTTSNSAIIRDMWFTKSDLTGYTYEDMDGFNLATAKSNYLTAKAIAADKLDKTGYVSASDYVTFTDAINAINVTSEDDFNAAANAAFNTLASNVIQPSADKLYRIYNTRYTGNPKFLYQEDGEALTLLSASANGPESFWTLIPAGDNKYTIRGYYQSGITHANSNPNNYNEALVDPTTVTNVQLTNEFTTSPGAFHLQSIHQGQSGRLKDGAKYPDANFLISWNESSDGNRVYLEEVTNATYPVAISANATDGNKYYGTLYNGQVNLTVPAGITASAVNVEGNNIVNSQEYAEGDVIPAGTAVLLTANNFGNYDFAFTTTNGTTPTTNLLGGSDATSSTIGGSKYYKLSRDAEGSDNSVGFYWGEDNGAAFTNGAHKAYLALPAETNVKAFWFGETETGVQTVMTEKLNDPIYNLAGQRLTHAQKGVYIQNGKKFIVK